VSNQPIQCGAYDPNTGISTYYVWLNAGKNVLNLQIGAISTTVTSFRISMSSS
jgi:NurA-like 5'-3' nuclease